MNSTPIDLRTATDRADLICAVIARSVRDDHILLEGIGTFLPTAGYELGRLLYAPKVVSLSPVGSVMRTRGVTLGLSRQEASLIAVGDGRFDYSDVALRIVPAYVPGGRRTWREFMRPGQVDRWGRTNNVVIGDYKKPKVRLPGAVGLPDGTPLEHEIQMYVPRHNQRTFVHEVDFVSTRGVKGSERLRPELPPAHPGLMITDLGIFRFQEHGGLRCESLHAGVTADTVRAATSFAVDIPADVRTTEAVTDAESAGLASVDPLGLRTLEMLTGQARRAFLRDALTAELNSI